MDQSAREASSFINRLCAALLKTTDHSVIFDAFGSMTGAQLVSQILWARRWLEAHCGTHPETVVAVTSLNTIQGLALRYGAQLLGATVCHLPFVSASQQGKMLEVIAPDLIVTDGTGPMLTGTSEHIQLMPSPLSALPAARPGDFTNSPYRSAQVCAIFCSGGTTGTPKATYRTEENYSRLMDKRPDPTRRQLVVTPLAYLATLLIDETLVGQGTVILGEPTWPVARVIDAAAASNATHLFLVEPALADLVATAQNDPRAARIIGSLRQILHMGAPAPRGLRTRAHDLFGDAVTHGYAASELGPVSTTSGYPFNPQTAGFPVAGVQYRVTLDDGSDAPVGEPGYITVKTPWKADGYWKGHPCSAFSEWFQTTDIGKTSSDGELTVLGRRETLLNDTGLYLSDLEALASDVEGLEYAIALPNPEDSGTIYIIAQSPDPAIQTTVEQAVLPLTVSRTIRVLITNRIPRTPQGKPDRNSIYQLFGHLAN